MQEAQARLQRALVVAKHATAAANEATAAVEAASAAAAASAATAECYARAAGVPLSATLGGDGDPFVISARAAARAARLARVEVEAASEAARAAIEAAAKRAAAVVVGPGGGSDGGGGKGRELALVEGEGGGGGDDNDDEGDYGNGFVDLVGNGDRDREGGAVHVEDEEEDDDGDDDGDDYGKRRRKTTAATTNANSSKRTRQHQQQFTASSPPPPPRPVGKETAAAVTRAANGDDDPAAPPGRRLLNGAGNGVYFDGGDGSKVRFRVSVTVAIPEEAAARLGLPVDDGDRRLVESPSSKSMPLVFIERAKFEESTFVYGENKKATPLSPSALAKARAYPPGEKRAQMLKKLFFPLTTVSQSSEFVYRGTHRAWAMRFFVYPGNKRQITSGLSPLIRDCFGSAALAGGRAAGAAEKKRDEAKRLSNLWELVVWRGQDRRGGGGGGGGKGKGRRGGGDDDDDDRTDEPGSIVLPSGQRVPAFWIEFAPVKEK